MNPDCGRAPNRELSATAGAPFAATSRWRRRSPLVAAGVVSALLFVTETSLAQDAPPAAPAAPEAPAAPDVPVAPTAPAASGPAAPGAPSAPAPADASGSRVRSKRSTASDASGAEGAQARDRLRAENERAAAAGTTPAEPPAPETEPAPAPSPAAAEPPTDYGHALQVGASGAVLGAYNILLRRTTSPLCETRAGVVPTDETKTCGFMAPAQVEATLSLGITAGLEPYAWGRFGLAATGQTNTAPLLAFGGGLRVYTGAKRSFKAFVAPEVGIELEGRGNAPAFAGVGGDYRPALLVGAVGGPQWDIFRFLSVFGQAGASVGFVRAIEVSLQFGGGLQLRTP